MFRSRWRAFRNRWRAPPVDPEVREARLSEWYRSPLGAQLLTSERDAVSEVVGSGYLPFLVQLDSGAHASLFATQGIHCKTNLVIARSDNRCAGPCVKAEFEHLPLQPESVDCLLIHHALEYAPAPHRVLREAVQALRPGGQIVVLGFNPHGLWGLRRWWAPWRRRYQPWEGQFLSPGRVSDWCRLLDCEVTQRQYYYHWPPLAHTRWKRRAAGINRLIRTLLPALGGGYLLVARKQQLIPLQPRRWETAFFLRGRAMNREREDVTQ